MKTAFKFCVLGLLFMLIFVLGMEDLLAQCPMCKAAAESNLKEGGSAAAGLNTGILYLFLTPYCLVASLGFVWWWKNVRKQDVIEEAPYPA